MNAFASKEETKMTQEEYEKIVAVEIRNNYEEPDVKVVRLVAMYFRLMDYKQDDMYAAADDRNEPIYQFYYAYQIMLEENQIKIVEE
jgi:hypothetical protein